MCKPERAMCTVSISKLCAILYVHQVCRCMWAVAKLSRFAIEEQKVLERAKVRLRLPRVGLQLRECNGIPSFCFAGVILWVLCALSWASAKSKSQQMVGNSSRSLSSPLATITWKIVERSKSDSSLLVSLLIEELLGEAPVVIFIRFFSEKDNRASSRAAVAGVVRERCIILEVILGIWESCLGAKIWANPGWSRQRGQLL